MQSQKLVLFLDVLGFSAFVSRADFGARFEAYIELIQICIQEIDPSITYAVFSDTIVFLHEPSEDSLLKMFDLAGYLMFRFLVEQELPIKGAISVGPVSHSRKDADVIIAGPPIIDAYRFEQKQDWIGIIASPEIARKFPSVLEYTGPVNVQNSDHAKRIKETAMWRRSAFRYGKIPLKGDLPEQNFYKSLAVVPHLVSAIDSAHFEEDLKTFMDRLNKLIFFAPTPETQNKYYKSMKFVEEVRAFWHTVWASQTCRDALWQRHETTNENGEKSVSISPPPRLAQSARRITTV